VDFIIVDINEVRYESCYFLNLSYILLDRIRPMIPAVIVFRFGEEYASLSLRDSSFCLFLDLTHSRVKKAGFKPRIRTRRPLAWKLMALPLSLLRIYEKSSVYKSSVWQVYESKSLQTTCTLLVTIKKQILTLLGRPCRLVELVTLSQSRA